MSKIVIIVFSLIIGFGCGNNPKVITSSTESKSEGAEYNTGVFGSDPSSNSTPEVVDSDVHTVMVKEVLPTDKYVYLNVSENGKDFWIATRKQEVVEGQTYHYKGGLLKRNFESKEYNRIFEEVYLVGNIVPSGHGMQEQVLVETQDKKQEVNSASITRHPTATKIADIVNSPKEYEGKEVTVSGKCTKLNANIMGRNWIHIKDGSMDDYDFVVTSDVAVPEGHIVTLKGILTLDKDFGAGYRYDLIIENASVVQ